MGALTGAGRHQFGVVGVAAEVEDPACRSCRRRHGLTGDDVFRGLRRVVVIAATGRRGGHVRWGNAAGHDQYPRHRGRARRRRPPCIEVPSVQNNVHQSISTRFFEGVKPRSRGASMQVAVMNIRFEMNRRGERAQPCNQLHKSAEAFPVFMQLVA